MGRVGTGEEEWVGGGAGQAQCMEGGALWAQELGVGGEGRWALRCQAGHLRDPPPAGSLRALEQVTSSSELRVPCAK